MLVGSKLMRCGDMTPSPLDAIVHEAARKLLTLRMTRISGAGDKIDADNLIADLDALASIFDGVILEVGKYAQAHIGISPDAVKDHFTSIVRDGLDGYGIFHIEEAGKQAQEHLQGAA